MGLHWTLKEYYSKRQKKYIIKYFLNCKKNSIRPTKVKLVKELGITVSALSKTYGNFIKFKYKI
jgi:hypothetical protein